MLSLILSGLVALAQAAPQPIVSANVAADLPINLKHDYEIVSKFVKEVSGPQQYLANWTGSDICKWEGFYCDTNPSTNIYGLASIDLNGFQLTGKLDLAVWVPRLTELALLHLNSNGFSGKIPDLRQLKYLYEIDLSNNKFSGPFPEKVYTAPGLTFLDLRFNAFIGAIPAKAFTTFTQIEALFLNNNQFTGRIPDSVGAFAGLYLSLANNQLSGSIPVSLKAATKLKEVMLLGNQLSGSIPSGLSACVQLEVFDVSNNQLTGTVPEDLCAIKTLKVLNVSGNKISAALGPKCRKALAKGILKL